MVTYRLSANAIVDMGFINILVPDGVSLTRAVPISRKPAPLPIQTIAPAFTSDVLPALVSYKNSSILSNDGKVCAMRQLKIEVDALLKGGSISEGR